MLNLSTISKKIKCAYSFIKNKLLFNDIAHEDLKRKKFILNILCLGMIFFSFLLLFFSIYYSYKNNGQCIGLPIIIIILLILVILISFLLSKKGSVLPCSFIILLLMYFCVLYASFHWGADLPIVLIALFIMVLMAGILINSKASLICAILLSIHLWIFNYIGDSKIIKIDYDWKDDFFNQSDVIKYSFLLCFAALFSWLSNDQSEKSLKTSKDAEEKLVTEMENQETKIKERTEEMKAQQIEKINSMYRMIEFGRISSGLFHDIMSPLTNIIISLEMLKMEDAKESVKHLIPSIRKIENLIQQSRKHIKIDNTYTLFSVKEEIESVLEILKSKAIKNDVHLLLPKRNQGKELYGSQTLFSHIIMNLVSNGIDSHDKISTEEIAACKYKKVIVLVKSNKDTLNIKIIDNGHGIDKETLDKIFEPFYTTKQEHGCGIGLSATKHILEKYFNGKIGVKSELQKGTIFTLSFPLQR